MLQLSLNVCTLLYQTFEINNNFRTNQALTIFNTKFKSIGCFNSNVYKDAFKKFMFNIGNLSVIIKPYLPYDNKRLAVLAAPYKGHQTL